MNLVSSEPCKPCKPVSLANLVNLKLHVNSAILSALTWRF